MSVVSLLTISGGHGEPPMIPKNAVPNMKGRHDTNFNPLNVVSCLLVSHQLQLKTNHIFVNLGLADQ